MSAGAAQKSTTNSFVLETLSSRKLLSHHSRSSWTPEIPWRRREGLWRGGGGVLVSPMASSFHQRWYCRAQKLHLCSASSLNSLPKFAFTTTVPMLAWLNTDCSRLRRVEHWPLPFIGFSFLWPVSVVILWSAPVLRIPQTFKHLYSAKQ